jgi:hypothetical protein
VNVGWTSDSEPAAARPKLRKSPSVQVSEQVVASRQH